jgi:hypothetical protein
MTVQFHRPRPGERFTAASGAIVRIDQVYHETRREVFRVSWLDPDAPQGRRGGQIERAGEGWRLY